MAATGQQATFTNAYRFFLLTVRNRKKNEARLGQLRPLEQSFKVSP
jgi:hypothetical protein